MRFVKRSRIATEPDRRTAERERRRERITHSFVSIYYGNVKMFYVAETGSEGEEEKWRKTLTFISEISLLSCSRSRSSSVRLFETFADSLASLALDSVQINRAHGRPFFILGTIHFSRSF